MNSIKVILLLSIGSTAYGMQMPMDTQPDVGKCDSQKVENKKSAGKSAIVKGPFRCPFEGCTKKPSVSQNARYSHIASHTKQQPFKCPKLNCPVWCADPNAVRKHREDCKRKAVNKEPFIRDEEIIKEMHEKYIDPFTKNGIKVALVKVKSAHEIFKLAQQNGEKPFLCRNKNCAEHFDRIHHRNRHESECHKEPELVDKLPQGTLTELKKAAERFNRADYNREKLIKDGGQEDTSPSSSNNASNSHQQSTPAQSSSVQPMVVDSSSNSNNVHNSNDKAIIAQEKPKIKTVDEQDESDYSSLGFEGIARRTRSKKKQNPTDDQAASFLNSNEANNGNQPPQGGKSMELFRDLGIIPEEEDDSDDDSNAAPEPMTDDASSDCATQDAHMNKNKSSAKKLTNSSLGRDLRECPIEGCDVEFSPKKDSRGKAAHVALHANLMPFVCQTGCGKSFAQDVLRYKHHCLGGNESTSDNDDMAAILAVCDTYKKMGKKQSKKLLTEKNPIAGQQPMGVDSGSSNSNSASNSPANIEPSKPVQSKTVAPRYAPRIIAAELVASPVTAANGDGFVPQNNERRLPTRPEGGKYRLEPTIEEIENDTNQALVQSGEKDLELPLEVPLNTESNVIDSLLLQSQEENAMNKMPNQTEETSEFPGMADHVPEIERAGILSSLIKPAVKQDGYLQGNLSEMMTDENSVPQPAVSLAQQPPAEFNFAEGVPVFFGDDELGFSQQPEAAASQGFRESLADDFLVSSDEGPADDSHKRKPGTHPSAPSSKRQKTGE